MLHGNIIVCEIQSWCPVEDEGLVLGKERPLITGSETLSSYSTPSCSPTLARGSTATTCQPVFTPITSLILAPGCATYSSWLGIVRTGFKLLCFFSPRRNGCGGWWQLFPSFHQWWRCGCSYSVDL